MLPEKDTFVWAMFFSSVVAMQYHPGNRARMSLFDCGEIADEMLTEYLRRMAELELVCRG